MGSWGTGIFEDDLALDVRGLYRELLSLKFADDAILTELQQEYGDGEGFQESTFWIALALLQHQVGRLDEGVQRQALQLIDSGRALQDWADLTEEGDRSIAARGKVLAKAKATILSAQPKRKTPRPDKDVLERIDKTYTHYPWKQGDLYAYRLTTGEYVVLAVTRVYPTILQRHYARQGGGFVRVKTPEVLRALHLVLDYRQPRLPTAAELQQMQPVVKPIPSAHREPMFEVFDRIHADYAAKAVQTFEQFTRSERARHPNKTDEEFHAHYLWSLDWYKKERDRHSDREHALRRNFYLSIVIDFREGVPEERLIDLGVARHFDIDNHGDNTTWETLDDYLVHGRPFGLGSVSFPW